MSSEKNSLLSPPSWSLSKQNRDVEDLFGDYVEGAGTRGVSVWGRGRKVRGWGGGGG